MNEEMTQADLDKQRADHYQHLYEQASEGRCGYSGMTLPECKGSICDCFEFPWVKGRRTPENWAHPNTMIGRNGG